MADAPRFDYVVVNDDVAQATGDLAAIVRAARLKRTAPATCAALLG